MLKALIKGEISQDDYLHYNNSYIAILDMREDISGFIYNYKDIKVIMINEKLSYYERKKTILHEFAHLELNHLYKKNILAFRMTNEEDEADDYIKQLLKEIKEEN